MVRAAVALDGDREVLHAVSEGKTRAPCEHQTQASAHGPVRGTP